MAPTFPTLRDFAEALELRGELVRIKEPVSPLLEIAELADRMSKARCANPPSATARDADPRHFDRGGYALLFEDVEGSDFPVLINAYGSYRRMELALGATFAELAARIGFLAKPEPPRGWREGIRLLNKLRPLARIGPKRVRAGVCQEIIYRGEQVDLTRLPIIRCWPLDGDLGAVGAPRDINRAISGVEWDNENIRGRYITFAGVHSIHADDARAERPRSHNIGMYRVQLLGPRRVAMHWHMHHDGAAHWRSWKKLGKPMPVAIVLGGESVLPYAATAPLPPGMSELLMAGFLHGSGIPMVKARTVPVYVPANAEIVIEGYVSTEAGMPGFDPDEGGELGPGAVFEGPFGDHTGFYSLPDRYPIVEVTALTHRRGAIYPTTIVGLPPQEDYYLGKATERIFLPLLQTLIPDIVDYDLPMFGAFHNCAVIAIRKQYPMQARKVMHAVWGAGQMAWTKCVIVVDDDVDVHDLRAVLKAMADHCDPRRDLERAMGPLDILDHAAPALGAGGKVGFDCTRSVRGEDVHGVAIGGGRDWRGDAGVLERVEAVAGVARAAMLDEAPGWLFVRKEAGAARGAVVAHLAEVSGLPAWVLLLDHRVDLRRVDEALFFWLANMDPSRDLVSAVGGSVIFDSTSKGPAPGFPGRGGRPWPPVIEMDEGTRALVDGRMTAYGLSESLESVGGPDAGAAGRIVKANDLQGVHT